VFICLSIYLSICLSVCLSHYLSIYLSIHPSFYLYVCTYPHPARIRRYQTIRMFQNEWNTCRKHLQCVNAECIYNINIYRGFCAYVHIFIYNIYMYNIYISTYLHTHVHIFTCINIYLYTYIYTYIYIYIYMYT